MITSARRTDLEKQGYRIVGNHSAIKVCHWTKRCIRGEDVCYKNTFYGINTHRCVQMTPALAFCNHRCSWCWRDIGFTKPQWEGEVDDPDEIIDGCIREHVRYLQGFGGCNKRDERNFSESLEPLHFAISLSGEPSMYPGLPELIRGLKERKLSSFLVTNGTRPQMIEKLRTEQPTQLYVTLPAPDEETYRRFCNPIEDGGWGRIRETLGMISDFERSTIRLTLVSGQNMTAPDKYAVMVEKAKPLFLEAKAYVWVGHSRKRLEIENMPLHADIVRFAREIEKNSSYKIVDEKPNSRVVLLMRKDFDGRRMEFF